MNIRAAKQSDKETVLRFCTNTFEWGDYIDQVWDRWCGDRNGVLMAVEKEEHNKQTKKRCPSVIAISHVSLCHNKKTIWLEGIRVKPNYRRKYVATELINKMIDLIKEIMKITKKNLKNEEFFLDMFAVTKEFSRKCGT